MASDEAFIIQDLNERIELQVPAHITSRRQGFFVFFRTLKGICHDLLNAHPGLRKPAGLVVTPIGLFDIFAQCKLDESVDSFQLKCFRAGAPSQFDKLGLSARSAEHTSDLQSLMRISYAVFCLEIKTDHFEDQKNLHKMEMYS